MNMGQEPDYRFSLANERTFLAWIRTSLAFLATSIGVDLLRQDNHTGILRHGEWLVFGLALVSIVTGGLAFLRWYQNEKAMRLETSFHYSHSLLLLTLAVISFAALIILLSL
jgi:putative membrane protein